MPTRPKAKTQETSTPPSSLPPEPVQQKLKASRSGGKRVAACPNDQDTGGGGKCGLRVRG